MRNHTAITTFILLGLTDDPNLQILLFVFLLITYMLSIIGNLIILLLTSVDSRLKTPMYYFLQNFSILEILFTSVTIPRFIYSLATGDQTIAYYTCAFQLFFGYLFGVTEFFLLATMSYDRYVAICKPLHYMTIMSHRVCKRLYSFCWFITLLILIPLFILVMGLEFCDCNALDHFICDANAFISISCSNTQFLEKLVMICAAFILIATLMFVVWSYTCIIQTILRFPSAQQRKKAFSTCSSHMIVVSITYGSLFFIYIKPTAKDEMSINKGVTLLATSISPMINPFIYSLRNKQVIQAFNDLVKKLLFSRH
ncbi:olfactory receptor 6C2-like [Suncus etruscus]|uniref:olfactory receptor 6C2-like n=1 Tax=Suncus etruscus TaxID=109475 RepID=UPI0021103CCE|nr:olfactory receptor 6C2-like [Suncus etruscus]